VKSVERRVAGLDKEVAGLKQENAGLNTTVAALIQENAGLNTELAALKQLVADVIANISSVDEGECSSFTHSFTLALVNSLHYNLPFYLIQWLLVRHQILQALIWQSARGRATEQLSLQGRQTLATCNAMLPTTRLLWIITVALQLMLLCQVHC
jgi:hypothetical protein